MNNVIRVIIMDGEIGINDNDNCDFYFSHTTQAQYCAECSKTLLSMLIRIV